LNKIENFNYRERKREFMIQLELAITRDAHTSNGNEQDRIPKCLAKHIKNANNELNKPYTKTELRKLIKTIIEFLYDMTENREQLYESNCLNLVEYIDYIPDPCDILDYKRVITY